MTNSVELGLREKERQRGGGKKGVKEGEERKKMRVGDGYVMVRLLSVLFFDSALPVEQLIHLKDSNLLWK